MFFLMFILRVGYRERTKRSKSPHLLRARFPMKPGRHHLAQSSNTHGGRCYHNTSFTAIKGLILRTMELECGSTKQVWHFPPSCSTLSCPPSVTCDPSMINSLQAGARASQLMANRAQEGNGWAGVWIQLWYRQSNATHCCLWGLGKHWSRDNIP